MPSAYIRLLIPQAFVHIYGGSAHLEGSDVKWTLTDGPIVDIPLDNSSNLPLIHDFVCSPEDLRIYGSRFQNLHSIYYNQTVSFKKQQVGAGNGANYGRFVSTYVTDETNQNNIEP